MRRRLFLLMMCVLALGSTACARNGRPAAGDWIVLFDGTDASAWRAFNGAELPAGWEVVDGALTLTGEAGDIVTREKFANFELELEWQIEACGNGGVFFNVIENDSLQYVWQSGPEMQILDNTCHPDGKLPETSAGSNFAVHAPARDVTKPAGEWNHARLIHVDGHVEHWLNGEKMLEYELGSADWNERVKNSKFATMPHYGTARSGHIALQDHGNRVAFRNIRIRRLP